MATDLGTDLSCLTDLTATMSTVSGRRLLAEAIARRLQTPRGGLLKHPDYGFDLAGHINDDINASDIAVISSGVEAECLKDERVISATCACTFAVNTLTVVVTITDADGPFVLILAATAVSVTLVSSP